MNTKMSMTKEVIWEENGFIKPKKNFDKAITKNECVITTVISDSNGNGLLTDTTKSRKKVSGIYKIVNRVNGKYYVGSSKDVIRRKYSHFSFLRYQKHKNPHLQNAWNKYGEHNFDFVIIEEGILESELKNVEQQYLNIAKNESSKCYNVSYDAYRLEMTKEIRSKISRSHFGLRPSLEASKRRSKSMMGKSKGRNHYKYNHVNYTFVNIQTKDSFLGTMGDFCDRFELGKPNVCNMIHGKRKSVNDWVLQSS